MWLGSVASCCLSVCCLLLSFLLPRLVSASASVLSHPYKTPHIFMLRLLSCTFRSSMTFLSRGEMKKAVEGGGHQVTLILCEKR
jgi:hypothetical protein